MAWDEVSVSFGVGWIPPLVGGFKCNLDVAMRSSHSVLAVVVCDHVGSLCTLYMERAPHQDPLVGETNTGSYCLDC